MYEDSQRFSSEEEGDESSNVISVNPRSAAVEINERLRHRPEDMEPNDLMTFTARRDAREAVRSPLPGAGEDVETPELENMYGNIREESLQRILNRLSPNGRRAFLRTLSEGEEDVVPPRPFLLAESDTERDNGEGGERVGIRTEVDFLLDSPIPELTTQALIPIQSDKIIESQAMGEFTLMSQCALLSPEIMLMMKRAI